MELNNLADGMRLSKSDTSNGPLPGSISRLMLAYKASDEYADLKPRTRKDYAYYLDKIEEVFGQIPVRSLSALVVKTYYKRIRRETSITWAYHTRDEIRGLARHSTADASEHYVHPDARFVESVQEKRLARRNKEGAKVGN